MFSRLLIQLAVAVLITFLLIRMDPDSLYLRTDTLSVDWLGALIFVLTLWGIQFLCFHAFKRCSALKRWGFSLLVSIPAGIFAALLLYSLVFSLLWATEL